jgi:6-phosphogluconolactonase (cycloisomerase 2 family)
MPYLPFILGLQAHPTKQILYTGYVVSGFVATYSYDDDGNMTFVGATATASPISGICWFAISPDAKFMYTADAITNQVDVFSIADPLNPVDIEAVTLLGGKTPPHLSVFPTTPNLFDTNPFQLRTSPDGQFLFVVNHEVADPIGGSVTGNALHVLKIAPNGTLTEVPTSPRYLTMDDGVPETVHPLGVVVF